MCTVQLVLYCNQMYKRLYIQRKSSQENRKNLMWQKKKGNKIKSREIWMRAKLSCWLPLRFKHKNGIDFSWGWAMSRLDLRHASTTVKTYLVYDPCVRLWKKMTCESLVEYMKWVCMKMKKGKLRKPEFLRNGIVTQSHSTKRHHTKEPLK